MLSNVNEKYEARNRREIKMIDGIGDSQSSRGWPANGGARAAPCNAKVCQTALRLSRRGCDKGTNLLAPNARQT
jgi:hypothetical protein